MNKERTIDEIQKEILAVTTRIQQEFPEVYNVLPETPLSPGPQEDVELHEYEEYLEALKKHLEKLRNNELIQSREQQKQ